MREYPVVEYPLYGWTDFVWHRRARSRAFALEHTRTHAHRQKDARPRTHTQSHTHRLPCGLFRSAAGTALGTGARSRDARQRTSSPPRRRPPLA